MMWKLLIIIFGTSDPIRLCVTSASEPTMETGDMFLMSMPKQFNNGDLIVFNIRDRDIPIIHRIIQIHQQLSCLKIYIFI